MKLKFLAALVAGAFAVPMVAQAAGVADTMSIDGDIGVFYSDSSEEIGEMGSEINFNGSAEVDGVTYMGHMELDVNGTGNSVRMDEVRVGAKGGFGEVWLGEVDNACDAFDMASEDILLGGKSKPCRGSDVSNIRYKNKMGATEFAVSHNPNEEQSAIGARFGFGPAKVLVAYEDGVTTSEGADEGLASFGVGGTFGDFTANVLANDDDFLGVNAAYIAGNHVVWADYGDNDGDDEYALGYRMKHGKMDYIIEFEDTGSDDQTVVGMRYRF